MFNQPLLVGSVFLGGVASFLSPCILPIVPVYLGILSKGKKTVLNTFLFILGLSLTFVSIGFSFSFLTGIFFNDTIKVLAGILVIILGLHQTGILKFNFLEKNKSVNLDLFGKNSSLQAFLLGLTFSLGWTPCVEYYSCLSACSCRRKRICSLWRVNDVYIRLRTRHSICSIFLFLSGITKKSTSFKSIHKLF